MICFCSQAGDTKKHLKNTLRMQKKAEKKSGGVVDVNFEKPAIDQLFSEAQGIIHMVNAVMKPFLESFGVDEENGLSPFCRDFA